MSLLLEHQWEHALLAAVIEAAKRECPGCYLGRTAIQKLVYFVQVLDVPMRYKFRIHHYGPFCDEVPSALEWLQADSIVEDLSENDRYSNYAPAENWPVLQEKYAKELELNKETIQSVVKAMGGMDPNTLELIATLHYSFRWVQACGGNGPWQNATITKFKEIKKDKFSDDEISHWYDDLVAAELIEN